MEIYASIFYVVTYILLFPICLLIFFKSNICKVFKQGETNTIRLFYIFLALALDFLVTFGITKFIESVGIIITNYL